MNVPLKCTPRHAHDQQAFWEEYENEETEHEIERAGQDGREEAVCFHHAPAPPLSLTLFDEQFAACRSLLEKRARQCLGREDAEDIVSACYLEARDSLASYCSERSLTCWLLGILDNLLRQRSRLRWVRSEEPYVGDACPDDACDTQTAQGARQEAQHLQLQNRLRAVDLTARQYECVARVLKGETQQRIADAMHISQRMISYHLQAAAARLRREYHAQESDVDTHEYDPRGPEGALRWNAGQAEADDRHALDFFCECARHVIYRKPHSFDNQSTGEERERRRYQCLRGDAKQRKRK